MAHKKFARFIQHKQQTKRNDRFLSTTLLPICVLLYLLLEEKLRAGVSSSIAFIKVAEPSCMCQPCGIFKRGQVLERWEYAMFRFWCSRNRRKDHFAVGVSAFAQVIQVRINFDLGCRQNYTIKNVND